MNLPQCPVAVLTGFSILSVTGSWSVSSYCWVVTAFLNWWLYRLLITCFSDSQNKYDWSQASWKRSVFYRYVDMYWVWEKNCNYVFFSFMYWILCVLGNSTNQWTVREFQWATKKTRKSFGGKTGADQQGWSQREICNRRRDQGN